MVGDVVDVRFGCFLRREEDVDVYEWSLTFLDGYLVDCAAADVLEDLQERGGARDVAEEDAPGLELWFFNFTAITITITIITVDRGSNIRIVGLGNPRNVSDTWLVAFWKHEIWKWR